MSTLDRTSFPEQYYAVIFSYQSGSNLDGYSEMDEETIELAQTMPGFLGYESKSNSEGTIFISYWLDRAAIDHWAKNARHQEAKRGGRSGWYAWYHSQISKVEHSHYFQFEKQKT
jgi:heme-degrading monooxygenase HmoA